MQTLLVANRGEIARRVIRTARARGLRTVALFTDLDRGALHVRDADEAVHVPGYLDIDAVVAAARRVGADLVHPGYGFLSERAAFARAVEEAGLTLVGPSPAVMDVMGRKDAAREVALAAGVPVVPSYSLDDDPAGLAYPVLVKAAAGGGGKGMRVVRSADDLDAAVAAARRESSSAFGDDTLLLEKYVESGRHIEVQVMGDTQGTVLHLFERDCSTQRRHQKVLEEAPAPTISEEVRRVVTEAAVSLARHVGYTGAGTVEFLLDTTTEEVYFLEMNTRLQVEHPVTELAVRVAGEPLDLVDLQLRVATGEPLGIAQDEVELTGHAIEARVYAEDSFGGFLPQAGTATLVRWPESGDRAASAGEPPGRRAEQASTVRVDHALESGSVVSTAYDPMLGKVIAHGPDRESARRSLVAALDETVILGLTTNTGFLRALVAGPEFRDAAIDTAWLDSAEVRAPSPDLPRVVAAWTSAMLLTVESDPADPFRADGWRLGGDPTPVTVELDRPVLVDRAGGTVTVPGADGGPETVHDVAELSAAHHVVVLTVDDRRVTAVVNATAHQVEVAMAGHRHLFARPDVFADQGPAAGDGTLIAPMPGTVLDVTVAQGQQVVEGQVLGMMEAMKMELALTAPFDGVVADVGATAGDRVALGATLFVVEAPAAG